MKKANGGRLRSVHFVLPHFSRRPIGGYKIVYEHANRLAQAGWRVLITQEAGERQPQTLWHRLKKKLYYWKLRFVNRVDGVPWFALDPSIKFSLVSELTEKKLSPAEFTVATAWQTARIVSQLSGEAVKKFYFIQDYECYRLGDAIEREQIRQTYQLGMQPIATSQAVLSILDECGLQNVSYVPCALDLNTYYLQTPLADPKRRGIGFPVRPEAHKGTDDAIEALRLVRAALGPSVLFWAFGAKRPLYLPHWIAFQQRPTDQELAHWYNQSAIFVLPSIEEGWGLPGSEAQACGAALVAVDNAGVRGYARHGVTALLSPPRNAEALAANILMLWRDAPRRIEMAREGYGVAQRLDWKSASSALVRALDRPSS